MRNVQEYQEESQAPNFTQANSLIRRQTTASHKIGMLTKKQQNIEIVFIILSKQSPIKTKNDTITQCLIADETASIFMNLYNDIGVAAQEGDIFYASGVYTSYFKQMLLVYQGSQSIIKRIGRFCMRFNNRKNMSQQSLEHQL